MARVCLIHVRQKLLDLAQPRLTDLRQDAHEATSADLHGDTPPKRSASIGECGCARHTSGRNWPNSLSFAWPIVASTLIGTTRRRSREGGSRGTRVAKRAV